MSCTLVRPPVWLISIAGFGADANRARGFDGQFRVTVEAGKPTDVGKIELTTK